MAAYQDAQLDATMGTEQPQGEAEASAAEEVAVPEPLELEGVEFFEEGDDYLCARVTIPQNAEPGALVFFHHGETPYKFNLLRLRAFAPVLPRNVRLARVMHGRHAWFHRNLLAAKHCEAFQLESPPE